MRVCTHIHTHCRLIRAVHHLACFKVRIPLCQFQLSSSHHLSDCVFGVSLTRLWGSITCQLCFCGAHCNINMWGFLFQKKILSSLSLHLSSVPMVFLSVYSFRFKKKTWREHETRDPLCNLSLLLPILPSTPPARGAPEEPLFTGSCCGQGGSARNLVLGCRRPGEAKGSSPRFLLQCPDQPVPAGQFLGWFLAQSDYIQPLVDL